VVVFSKARASRFASAPAQLLTASCRERIALLATCCTRFSGAPQVCNRSEAHTAQAAIKPHLPTLLACLRLAPDCALSHSAAWLEPFVSFAACWIAEEEREARRREEMAPIDTNAGTVSAAARVRLARVRVLVGVQGSG